MYNHTLSFETQQQARKAERALWLSPIDCSNVHVSSSQISFQTTYRLEELARLRSELQATGSSFNIWEPLPSYAAGLWEADVRKHQAQRLVFCQPETSFTEQARTVLRLAQEEAQHFHHNSIGTEHLLLALIGEGEGIAAKVLASLGIDLQKARHAVAFIIGHGHGNPRGEINLTPRAQRVIKLAASEAHRMDEHATSTEHLLLGLVLEGEGVGAGVLESLGVNLEKVRRQTLLATSPFGMPLEHDDQSLNGCPYCGDPCEDEDLEEDETDIIGNILFFMEQLAKLLAGIVLCLVGAVFCLVAIPVLLLFAIAARTMLFLLELDL